MSGRTQVPHLLCRGAAPYLVKLEGRAQPYNPLKGRYGTVGSVKKEVVEDVQAFSIFLSGEAALPDEPGRFKGGAEP